MTDYDRIWAPWRIDYILDEKEEGCFFCMAFEASQEEWKERKMLYLGEHAGMILNKYPYNNGHVLVAPVRHQPELSDLESSEKLELVEQVEQVQELCKETIDPDGFNVGMNVGEVAGAGFPDHLHVHVVPRWSGDHNFMPVTASAKVIPQSLDELYDLFREHLTGNE